jgi:putative ABC transport system permease protein
MRFLPLVVRNLLRKKMRTLLTVGSFAAALFLFGLLAVIGRAMSQGVDVAGVDRLIVRNRVSLIMPLPHSYGDQMRRLDGVRDVTWASWFGGVYQDERNFFPQFAIDPESYRRVYPEWLIDDEQWSAFLADREACAVGRDLAERFGWQVGDRIPLRGTIFPGTWEFNIRAIYDSARPQDPTSDFWFRYDYLEERRPFMKGMVGWYVVQVADPARSLEVTEAVDDRFANSPFETRTETEQAFVAGFANQMGNIQLIILTVGGIVFFTLLLVSGNTMAIAVRERMNELAVMKTMGFSNALLLVLVCAEAVVLAVLGAGLGLTMAKGFTLLPDPTNGMLPIFYLSPGEIVNGLILAVLVGVLSGMVPGLAAVRTSIVSGLRGV